MDKIKNKWQQDRIRHNLTYRSVVKVKWKHENGTLHPAGLITDMRSEQRVSRWRGGGYQLRKWKSKPGGDVKTLAEQALRGYAGSHTDFS